MRSKEIPDPRNPRHACSERPLAYAVSGKIYAASGVRYAVDCFVYAANGK